uniref:TauD/TfdA-like domain-containing protein n=1 Tax=Chromera velia CCMP2878 TaxID=1169474 RepID=A0A0G4HY94_9ALVE|eukprot:Cvel_9442.t1-p1 / transcript=Cvel_9442.t1 / gene=Cvel_9442 / organism=Chromera_velia_CCMP2878 / gene_product=hypothetical protein / transcript_product=hypothetical protein / location=Cvel_scaffold544:48802-49449(-) / protein_length=216 / sequence_SO=supercontig / SO=protein_coding / is_pseudo=false
MPFTSGLLLLHILTVTVTVEQQPLPFQSNSTEYCPGANKGKASQSLEAFLQSVEVKPFERRPYGASLVFKQEGEGAEAQEFNLLDALTAVSGLAEWLKKTTVRHTILKVPRQKLDSESFEETALFFGTLRPNWWKPWPARHPRTPRKRPGIQVLSNDGERGSVQRGAFWHTEHLQRPFSYPEMQLLYLHEQAYQSYTDFVPLDTLFKRLLAEEVIF